jgi:hypothetical protein
MFRHSCAMGLGGRIQEAGCTIPIRPFSMVVFVETSRAVVRTCVTGRAGPPAWDRQTALALDRSGQGDPLDRAADRPGIRRKPEVGGPDGLAPADSATTPASIPSRSSPRLTRSQPQRRVGLAPQDADERQRRRARCCASAAGWRDCGLARSWFCFEKNPPSRLRWRVSGWSRRGSGSVEMLPKELKVNSLLQLGDDVCSLALG